MLIRPQKSVLANDSLLRLRSVRAQIAAAAQTAGRSEGSITVVAVSKGHSAAAVRELAVLGIKHFGESYLQEAVPKLDALADTPLTWHFVGRLQANKTRVVAERFDWVHGLDRLRIAERLAQHRPPDVPPLNICLQVKLSEDDTKGGVAAEELPVLIAALAALPRLRLRGLMCILPAELNGAQQSAYFDAVCELQQRLITDGALLDTLSMGMSGDFERAIASGATLLRVGSALFGLASISPAS